MIITTKQFLSSVWLLIAIIVATLLAVALPGTANAQNGAAPELISEGIASYYNLSLHGAKTASGERYDHKALTAAHASLPFDTMVKVTSVENNLFVIVRINDRMKKDSKRIIDLSGAAAEKIGLFEAGITEVKLTLIEVEQLSLKPNDRISRAANSTGQTNVEPPAQTSSSTVQVSSSIQEGSGSSKPTFTLQIGSFSSRDGAEKLAQKFPEAWIDRVETENELSFRVYYSRFEDEKPARVAQNVLWTKGQDSFLRKMGD